MVSRTTQSKQFSRSFKNEGFTILELLIALAVGGLVLSMALALTLANRDLMSADEARTALNQNLRSGADIIGDDIRIAGERLRGSPPTLMPIVIRNNTITLRNNLDDTIMTLCQTDLKKNGSNRISVAYTASPQTHSGCTPSPEKFKQWRELRTGKEGKPGYNLTAKSASIYTNPIPAVIPLRTIAKVSFLPTKVRMRARFRLSKRREHYRMTTRRISVPRTIQSSSPKIYFLKERRYTLKDGVVQLWTSDSSQPSGVIDNISKMEIVAVMNDDTRQSTLDKPSDWLKLRAIEITLEGTVTVRGKPVTRKLVSQIFPRNVLSK